MKNINDVLQFKIGEESYEREFEIIPIPPYEFVENNLSLEPYEYFGIINEILGINFSSTIILYYNADILMRLEYKIKGNIIEKLVKNIEEMRERERQISNSRPNDVHESPKQSFFLSFSLPLSS